MKISEAITNGEHAQILHNGAKALREIIEYRSELIRNIHLGNNSLQIDGEPARELLLVANVGLRRLTLENKAMNAINEIYLAKVIVEFDVDPDIIESYLRRLRPKTKKWWEFWK